MSRDDDEGPSLAARLFTRLFENVSLKIIAVVISVGLYVVLHSGADAQRTIDVEVFERPPEDPNVVGMTIIPSRVRVTVQGPRSLLDDINSSVEPILIDLSKAPTSIDLDNMDLKLPVGVKKMQIVPTRLDLQWDTKITKELPVEVIWSAPPPGLAIRNLTVEPSVVAITGPKTRLDLLQRLRTVPLVLGLRVAGINTQLLQVDVAAEPALVGSRLGGEAPVKLLPETVEARFELVPETKTRTFPNLVVLAMGGKGVTLRPRVVTVIATCPPSRADQLVADAIVPKVELDALGADFAKKGPEEADVKVEVPGCSEVTVSPSRVAVSR